jgi:predicted metal-dependent enzyme (double-stranded beta helix superfamily)
MSHTLEQFSSQCHDALKAEPGPAGRRKVCELLQAALKDKSFVAKNLDDTTPERKILYEDPELSFCILAHSYKGAKESPPHDHGPSWAIYGQAVGETQMSDFELVERATPETPGKVRKLRTYKLTPGVAHLYNEGDLHSPKRDAPTRLIRIEGVNMDKVKRLKFEAV